MTNKTELTDDEIIEAFATTPVEKMRVHYGWEVAALDAAVAAAETCDDPAVAQSRIDAEVVDAARRGISWSMIGAALGRFDLAALKNQYRSLL